MVDVENALNLINNTTVEIVTIDSAVVANLCGSVVAADVKAPISLPSFLQSSMDGYAVKFHNTRTYKLVGESQAGSFNDFVLSPGEGIRIFTGAKVPETADAVIIQEKVNRINDSISIDDSPQFGQNIRPIGSQIKKGTNVLCKGQILNPAALGILLSLGINRIKVIKKPSVTIVVTGDELVPVGTTLTHGKVFESNSIVLESALKREGIEDIKISYAKDTFDSTKEAVSKALESDLVLISGGISVGDYDFVQESLSSLGVEECFYKVRQKPGKPLLFGKKRNTYIFALPGNPASTLNCFYIYVIPILYKLLGRQPEHLPIVDLSIDQAIENMADRALFLKAKSIGSTVHPIDEFNSATLMSFSKANALVYVPDNVTLAKGNLVKAWLLPN